MWAHSQNFRINEYKVQFINEYKVQFINEYKVQFIITFTCNNYLHLKYITCYGLGFRQSRNTTKYAAESEELG